jgi:hypothetical protein
MCPLLLPAQGIGCRLCCESAFQQAPRRGCSCAVRLRFVKRAWDGALCPHGLDVDGDLDLVADHYAACFQSCVP